MKTLYLDLETYSPIDIKAGAYRYCEAVEVLIIAYAVDDRPVQVWDWVANRGYIPDALRAALNDNDVTICAHNSSFDRTVLRAISRVPLDRQLSNLVAQRPWRDTMVKAYSHSLPGSLGQLSEIFNLGDGSKDKRGFALIQLFCKPQKDGTRASAKTHPKQWAEFLAYAKKDIEAMRLLDKKIPSWNDTPQERALWYLDQKINDRGFATDTDLATAAVEAVEQERKRLNKRTLEITEGDVSAATQRDALLKHLLEMYGVSLPDMQISTLNRRLEDPELPPLVKELLALRLQSAGNASSKYKALLKSVCSDGRLRGTLQFCGAFRTGRWSGRIFQPQNMPRPSFKNREIDLGIEAIKARAADLIYPDVKALTGSALRGVLVAPEGKKLVVADLSAIEGRVLAWLAGETWKIKAYRDLDAGRSKYDLYELTYANTFGVDPATVTSAQRQLGKVLELALGYQGGPGAFVTFANAYRIDLKQLAIDVLPQLEITAAEHVFAAQEWYEICRKEKTNRGLSRDVFVCCDTIKRLWREANPETRSFWYILQNTVCEAVEQGFSGGAGKLKIDKVKSWLRIQLPSGRYLSYPGARIVEGKIKYLGLNQYSRKWGLLDTYGGKLTENVVQAVARDVIAYHMQEAEAQGYEVVLSVHDELLTETPDTEEYNVEALCKIMSTPPAWAGTLPLSAAGFEAYRYRKD